MSDVIQELNSKVIIADAQIQSLTQSVHELTTANTTGRANLILFQNANKQLAEKCAELEGKVAQYEAKIAELEAKVAEVPVPAAEPVPAEASPAEEAAA